MSCWAPGLQQSESETELSSTSKEISERGSSELDLEEAYQQLEKMKQRILQMKSKIVRSLPEPEPVADQVPSDSDNVNLREIQLETLRGFQQIEAAKLRLKETSEELVIVGARIEESRLCTEKLAKQLEEVPRYIEAMKHQVGVCLERYNELETSYCSDIDYGSLMQPYLKKLKNKYRTKVPLRCYKIEYRGIARKLCGTRNMLSQYSTLLMHCLWKIDDALTPRQMPFLLVKSEMLKEKKQDYDKPPGYKALPATIAKRIPTL